MVLLYVSLLSASLAAGPLPPNPRIVGGWTNCPPTCADSCVPPLGPQISAHGGKIISKEECLKTCGADGSGDSSCNAYDMGIPHNKTRGPSFSFTWGATAVLPGRFGGNAVAPINGDDNKYPYHWVTVGGADTKSSNWEETAESDILKTGKLL